jgi:alkylated DNA repair protein alkB family protein 1
MSSRHSQFLWTRYVIHRLLIPDDSLMGHQDKSEENTTAPLVSFSLGHSCIYLLGTEDRNDKPIPIVLESGDVLIIRDAARQRFHGVPKILENSLPLYLYPSKIATLAYIETIDVRNGCFRLPKLRNDLELLEDQEDKDDWDLYGSYMLESRININIRKVEV